MNGSALIVIGLLLDILGVVMLFWVAPEKHLHPQAKISFKLNEADAEKWEAKDRKRRRLAAIALGIIIGGFVLQLIGEVCG